MLKKVLILLVVVVFLLPYGSVLAECPEGKSEILIVTPSGKQKTICVPDQALPGIENAAENSPGIVAPVTCTAFEVGEIQQTLQTVPYFSCIEWVDSAGDVQIKCGNNYCYVTCPSILVDPEVILEYDALTEMGTYYVNLVNLSIVRRGALSQDEFAACSAILQDQNIVCPPCPPTP
jgi:hypothetical protein